jgi:integrase
LAMDLSKVGKRGELKSQREPYWQRLRAGAFIGFRPSQRGGPGTWIARSYDADARKYKMKSLGDFGTLPGNDRFAAAKKEAELFAAQVESGGLAETRAKIETVKDACEDYAKTHADEADRLKRLVYGDPIDRVKLNKLRKHHIEAWRARVEALPALVSRRKEGEKVIRARSPSTVNRDLVPLRAALSKHLAPGSPNSAAAWQEALKPIKNAGRQRTLYLDIGERRKLVEKLETEAMSFVKAIAMLPLRPGAMAGLNAGDFDKRTRELTIGMDKTGKPRRIAVPIMVADFLTEQTQNKLPTAPMFMRGNGKRWTKDDWNDPIRRAAIGAGLSSAMTAYVFRHSVLTDLVNGGLPILTVAQMSDTSVEMIERHYGHLNKSAAEQALAALAL